MLNWYVGKVKPRGECRLQSYLGQHGVEIFAPEIVTMKRGKECMEPLFPGYVFVRTGPLCGNWNLVRWARGLSYLLPVRDRPAAISESVVEEIRSRVGWWNQGGRVAGFEAGDHALVESGPLKSLDAIFQRYIPGKRRCEVLVSLFGRFQRVQVELSSLNSFAAKQRFAGLEQALD